MSEKPYKSLGIDLMAAVLRDRAQAIDTYLACHQMMESAKLAEPEAGPKAFRRLRAAAVNESLRRHPKVLDHAMAENAARLAETRRVAEAARHLRAMRAEAAAAARQMAEAGAEPSPRGASSGPSA